MIQNKVQSFWIPLNYILHQIKLDACFIH